MLKRFGESDITFLKDLLECLKLENRYDRALALNNFIQKYKNNIKHAYNLMPLCDIRYIYCNNYYLKALSNYHIFSFYYLNLIKIGRDIYEAFYTYEDFRGKVKKGVNVINRPGSYLFNKYVITFDNCYTFEATETEVMGLPNLTYESANLVIKAKSNTWLTLNTYDKWVFMPNDYLTLEIYYKNSGKLLGKYIFLVNFKNGFAKFKIYKRGLIRIDEKRARKIINSMRTL